MFLFLKWLTAGSVALVLLGWLARFLLLRGRFIYRGEHAFFLFLVIFSTLGASFLHHLFLGAPFLIDRFALYIVPLFWLSFIFLLDLFSAERSRVLITLPFAVIAAVMLVHSARVLDTGSFLIWRYDQDNKSVVSRLEQEYTTKTLQVSVSWFYEPAFNYYRISRELNWLEPFDRLGPKPGDDLLYLAEADTVLVPGYREELVVQRFPRSGSVLVRAAKP